MTERMTLPQAQAIHRIKNTPEGQTLLEWFMSSLDALREDAPKIEDATKLRWNQGAQQVLGRVVVAFNNSQAIISRFKT